MRNRRRNANKNDENARMEGHGIDESKDDSGEFFNDPILQELIESGRVVLNCGENVSSSWLYSTELQLNGFLLQVYGALLPEALQSFRIITLSGNHLVATSSVRHDILTFWQLVIGRLYRIADACEPDVALVVNALSRSLANRDLALKISSSSGGSVLQSSAHMFLSLPLLYAESVDSMDASLLCVTCRSPALAPRMRLGKLFCSTCLAAELNGEDSLNLQLLEFVSNDPPALIETALDNLLVQCPFKECLKTLPRRLLDAHCQLCSKKSFTCPKVCGFESKLLDQTILHFCCCEKLTNNMSRLWEEQGPFALIGKDCLEVIMRFLTPSDIVNLALVNRWFSSQVRENYSHLQCQQCHFFHGRQPLESHPGRWSDLSFFDVLHRRKSTLRLSDTIAVAKLAGTKSLLVAGASLAGGAFGVFLAIPLVSFYSIIRSSRGVTSAMSLPFRTGSLVGSAVYHVVKDRQPVLTEWTCCGRAGSYAEPCQICDGQQVRYLPSLEEIEAEAEAEAAARAAAAAADADDGFAVHQVN